MRGARFLVRKLEKNSQTLAIFLLNKSEVPSEWKGKEKFENQRGFGASVSGFTLVTLSKNFEKFGAHFQGQEPAVNKVREWGNLNLVCVWFGSRIYQVIDQILVPI